MNKHLNPGGIPTPAADALLELVLAQDKVASHMDWEHWKPLPEVREIDQDELGNTVFCTHTPVYTGCWHFPVIRRGKPVSHALCHANIFWNGTGVIFYRTWKWDNGSRHSWSLDGKYHRLRGPHFVQGMPRNKMTVRIYLFGCQHDYEERNDRAGELGVTLFSHDHLRICRKCGHHFVVDSSD